MMAADVPEAHGAGDMFAFGGDQVDTSDKGYSSGSSSQWPSVDSSSSGDQMTTDTTRSTRSKAYENVPNNVMKDL